MNTNLKCFIITNNSLELQCYIRMLSSLDHVIYVGHGMNLECSKDQIATTSPDIIITPVVPDLPLIFDMFQDCVANLVSVTFVYNSSVHFIKTSNFGSFIASVFGLIPSVKKPRIVSGEFNDQKFRGINFNRIAIPSRQYIELIDLDQIVYFKADASYTTIHFKDRKKIVSSKPLKEFSQQLCSKIEFYRIHQSFLININEIHKIIRAKLPQLIMSNGHSVNISRNKKKIFFEYMMLNLNFKS